MPILSNKFIGLIYFKTVPEESYSQLGKMILRFI